VTLKTQTYFYIQAFRSVPDFNLQV